MNLRPAHLFLIVLIVIALVVGSRALYVVHETEQVVVTQFGRPVGEPVAAAGLYFKIPFIQEVNVLDKRVLEWDGDPNQIPTKDKLFIHVDTFARWRIADPLLFFQRLRDERSAQSRLDDILDGETRSAIANHDLLEIVRSENRDPAVDESLSGVGDRLNTLLPIRVGRARIAREIFANCAPKLADLGIELLDIRFKRINYNPDVQEKIFDRMISERQQIAARFRSEGEGEAARILGQKERRLREIVSEAYKTVEEIRGRGDARATEIYAAVYNQSPEAYDFYQFTRTMETYERTLGKDTMLLLSTEGDFFRFLSSDNPGSERP